MEGVEQRLRRLLELSPGSCSGGFCHEPDDLEPSKLCHAIVRTPQDLGASRICRLDLSKKSKTDVGDNDTFHKIFALVGLVSKCVLCQLSTNDLLMSLLQVSFSHKQLAHGRS